MMAYVTKRLLGLGFAASAVYGFNASGLDTQYVIKDSHPVPDGWIRKGPAAGDHPITLHIGLREGMSLELEDLVYEGTANFLEILFSLCHSQLTSSRLAE